MENHSSKHCFWPIRTCRMSWVSTLVLQCCILPSEVPKVSQTEINASERNSCFKNQKKVHWKGKLLWWSGTAMDHQYWVIRISHEPNIPATDFGDSSKTVSYLKVETLRCQFGPSNTDTEARALFATANHAKYFQTSRIRTPNAELVQLHHNVVAGQTCSCHVLWNITKPFRKRTKNKTDLSKLSISNGSESIHTF